MNRHRVLLLCGALSAATLSAMQPDQPLPRFRAGANLVRVDAYVSLNGQPVTDLTAEDFEVLEDDKPQHVEHFELVQARGAGAVQTTTAATPSSTREMREAAQDPSARVFVIFLDTLHVSLDGSARSSAPIAAFLDKVVGPNDLVGVMTPEITPQNITLVRRGTGIDGVLKDMWTWGERDRLTTTDPRENDIKACYAGSQRGDDIAGEMIERRREQKTLRSIDSMIGYLDGLRDERKFVVLLSEGWVLFRRSDQLAAPLGSSGTVPGIDPIGVGTDGRIATGQQIGRAENSNFEWCERERVMLSFIDHELEVRQMSQRANRANVSFYPLDPRGLVVFDAALGPLRPPSMAADRDRLNARQDGLRELAEQTDGAWVLNTNDTGGALERMLADTNSYYLVSYYSTNEKLDGRFRRITVRVKREGADVRARPGYLAPTEAEARAAGAVVAGTARSGPPPAVSRALDAIAPARGSLPVRVQASGLPDRVRAVVELDTATLKLPEWQAGAEVELTIDAGRGEAPSVVTEALRAGQRSLVVEGPDEPLAPGRYVVRVEARPTGGASSVRASTEATVPGDDLTIGASTIAFRRGPTTGLAYEPTADPRFRRTERLRVEVPVLGAGAVTAVGRVLTREGQPLQIGVAITERTDDDGQRYLVADATLAPLAQGEFVLEVAVGKESANYGFRLVP